MRLTRNLIAAILLFGVGAVLCHAADVETITHGRAVELTDHLVPGKYVLFDFYADWCGPCRALEPHLLDLAGRHADRLAIRKVDVINWDSEVARQYRMSSIPYLVLYGPDGQKLAAGDAGSILQRLSTALGGGDASFADAGGGSRLIPLVAVAAIFVVAVGALVRRRSSTAETAGAFERRPPTAVDTAADPGDPAIWFAVLQGSMEGPFTRRQLQEMVRRRDLGRDARVRRRGDADWTDLVDALD
ncbi:MAG: thioredoxin domain-containing protein [Thermoanaerobaculales bacterium]|jgi:thiol-disulfide isomerase/thioredoxin|nr:thioredoxin domain-containing protein [Thermoanaerobaculales bacterium]